MRRILAMTTAATITALAMGSTASAQQIQNRTITIDENGNGTVYDGDMTSSLESGTIEGYLAYALPDLNVTEGQVNLLEPNSNEGVSDAIYFGNFGETPVAVFVSDYLDGLDALADNQSLPGFDNQVSLSELGPEDGPNGATYTPTANQPGYVPGFQVTYDFISDSAVPEPATWGLMLLGFGAIGMAVRRKREPTFANA